MEVEESTDESSGGTQQQKHFSIRKSQHAHPSRVALLRPTVKSKAAKLDKHGFNFGPGERLGHQGRPHDKL